MKFRFPMVYHYAVIKNVGGKPKGVVPKGMHEKTVILPATKGSFMIEVCLTCFADRRIPCDMDIVEETEEAHALVQSLNKKPWSVLVCKPPISIDDWSKMIVLRSDDKKYD